MCDFHSICVRRDGKIAHIPENSHSGAVEAAKWRENDLMTDFRESVFFVEAEWSGLGKFPGVDRITRNSSQINEKQRKAIEDHYAALAELLSAPEKLAEKYCLGTGRFSGEAYADVRWKVMNHSKCPKKVVEKLAQTSLFTDGSEIKSLHPSITKLSGTGFVIPEGYHIELPNLTEVSGSVVISENGSFTAPALTKSGYVVISENGSFTAPALTKSGSVDISENGSFTAPALTEVSGYVVIRAGGKLDAPNLKR